MIIRDDLRPTMIRTNSRYRGVTDSYQYSNYVGEVIHDMMLLGKVMDFDDSNPEEYVGHSNYIEGNLASYITGMSQIKSNISPVSKLIHVKNDVVDTDKVKLSEKISTATWTAYGNCIKSADGKTLQSPGTTAPSGIGAQLLVEEGQVIFIRLGVKLISGDGSAFAIGSNNINQGQGDMKKVQLPQNGSTIFIDKRLYCRHREPINLNIDVQYLPQQLGSAVVEISDVEIRYATEQELSISPLDAVMRPKINLLEDKLKNIIRNI